MATTFGDSLSPEPDSFALTAGGSRFVVTPTGGITRDGAVTHARIPLPRHFYIERLYGTSINGELVAVVQYSDGDDGASQVFRLSPDTVRWQTRNIAFNLGTPILRMPFLYVNALGAVGKVDLRTGAYTWLHDTLYTHAQYNDFDSTIVRGDSVLFYSRKRAVAVSDSTGALLSH